MHIKIPKLSEVSTASEPLPAAVYDVKITNAELKQSKSSESEMIAVEFTVSDGDFAKRKLWRNFSLVEKALVFLKELCEVADIEMSDDGLDTEDMLGAELKVQVGQKEYQGRIGNEIEKLYKAA